MHREGAVMPSDPEITTHTKDIVHHLLSFHRLYEEFFASLPEDIRLRDAEWDAIEHAVFTLQHAVNVKVSHLLDAYNALREELTDRPWEGVVLGLLLARRPDLLSTHPLVENAWVRMQAQQLLRQPPPDRREQHGGP
jgi:hypothetical protein